MTQSSKAPRQIIQLLRLRQEKGDKVELLTVLAMKLFRWSLLDLELFQSR